MRWENVAWEIVTEETPTCGAARGPRSATRCELPPDHVVGAATDNPQHWPHHFGRSRTGRWFSWPMAVPS